jgi:hypothetical protein
MDPTIAKPPAGRSLWSPEAWAALRAVGISQTYPPAVSLFEQGTPSKRSASSKKVSSNHRVSIRFTRTGTSARRLVTSTRPVADSVSPCCESSRRERSPRVLQILANRLRNPWRTQTTPKRRPRRASYCLLNDRRLRSVDTLPVGSSCKLLQSLLDNDGPTSSPAVRMC